jgi:glycosyltransferase involved in cell wall biosynthesis
MKMTAMTTDVKVSALIFTRQERRNLEELLPTLKQAVDEIVIVDGESTDGTIEVAQKYNSKIYETKYIGYVEPCRMFGFSKVSNDWVLYIDADERPSQNILMNLKKIIRKAEQKGFVAIAISRRNYITSHRWAHSDLFSPDFQVRIIKKTCVQYKGIVHEQPIIFGKKAQLQRGKYWFNHYCSDYYTIRKLAKYAHLAAKQRLNKKESIICSLGFPLTLVLRFIKYVILKKTYLDGIEGIRASLVYLSYLMLVDFLKGSRSKWWDAFAEMANKDGLTFLCNPGCKGNEKQFNA